MGGLFSRRPKDQFNPNYPQWEDPGAYGGLGGYGGPPGGYGGPPGGYGGPPGGYGGPPGGYGGPGYYPNEYDPAEMYGYGYPTDQFETMYGGPMRSRYNPYGGRYGRGLGQMSTMSPWNYGNFYMGNTTMQMIPMMQRKLAKFQMRQAMGGFGGMGGFGSMGGFGGMGGGMPMMPMMPMMPCLPAPCCTPAAAPMMAAATPLPSACSPLVQGMYPMASMSPANWMSPSSFMSALSAGPMAYRPPASMEFPSNVGMVMPFPYGTPNPLLSAPSFGGFNPQYNFNGALSCCCCYCTPPPVLPPAITYYPQPVSVPQPCPVPVPVPVPIPNIQQVPVPRPVTVVAPPIVAGCAPGLSVPSGAPLMPFQGGFSQGGFGQQLVMKSNQNTTAETLLSENKSDTSKDESSRSQFAGQFRRTKGQLLASSLSNLGLNNNIRTNITPSTTTSRPKSTRTSQYRSNDDFPSGLSGNRKQTTESGWLTSDELSSILKRSKPKRHGKSSRHSRSHRHKTSHVSEHDCVACKEKRLHQL